MALPLLVVTTVATREDAERLARTLVEQGLAACAQISAIDSFYAWQGRVAHDAEQRIVFKIAEGAYDAVEAAIRALHPYELPAIHAIALARAHAPYAAWIEANSRTPDDVGSAGPAV